MAAIDRSLHRCVIRCLGTETRSAGIAQHQAIFFGDDQPISTSQSKLVKPRRTTLHRVRLHIECDRCMDHVMVVYLRQPRKVGTVRRTNADSHGIDSVGKWFVVILSWTDRSRALCFFSLLVKQTCASVVMPESRINQRQQACP